MKNVIAITMATAALLLSLTTIAFQLKSKPLGAGIEKYSFGAPLEAYKSKLQMPMNKDFLALIQFEAAISDRKIKEKLETIKVNKTREHGGKTIMFFEYNEAGLPKQEVVGMEKDADSGYWHEAYTSAYYVKETNPALASEMEEWEKSK